MDNQSAALIESLYYILPEIILCATACVLFIGGTRWADKHLWNEVALGGLVAAFVALVITASQEPPRAEVARAGLYGAPVLFDNLAQLMRGFALLSGGLLLLLGWQEVGPKQTADHQACLLVVIAGAALAGCANDLVTLFLALEMVSIPTYIMLYLPRHDEPAQEAALKYFLLSVFSSALTLFGFSYIYGLTGTTNISAMVAGLNSRIEPMPVIAQIALVLTVAGLGFKITAAPFHFYAPDVYQGAPTVGAALLAYVPKLAGFIAIARVAGFVSAVEPGPLGRLGLAGIDHAAVLFWFLAVLSMTVGNFLALLQDNIKRLLAYSSVAHTGYMLMVLASLPFLQTRSENYGAPALFYYLAAYGAMTLGAFGVLSYLQTPERPIESIDDLGGLSRSHPKIALVMALFLFSLIGIPLTAGFTAKLFVFYGALEVGGEQTLLYRILAVIAVINAAVGGWYYLRIVAVMYLREPLKPIAARGSAPGVVMLVLCAILTLGLSVPSNWLLAMTRPAAPAPMQARR